MSTDDVVLYKCIKRPPGLATDTWDGPAIEMCDYHNTVIRAMNAMRVYSLEVDSKSKAEQQAFIFFCKVWATTLHHHHELEETYYFPELSRFIGDAMQINEKEHGLFQPHFEKFVATLDRISEGKEPYRGQTIKDQVEAFGQVLRDHLEHELATLDFKGKIPEAELKRIYKEFSNRAVADASLVTTFNCVLSCAAKKAAPDFPPAPAPLVYLAQKVTSWRHWRSWQYGTSSVWMELKPRFYAQEVEGY